ncbi:MAG: hypothetical protein HOI87_15030 [Rhodospirillaceae bacterium]|nr:hypothetical protein [Rhodospirillaceae bacterium]
MYHHKFSYEACLQASERVTWRIEDIIGGQRQLDFSKPFMPEALARVEPLTFLTHAEQRILNQIRGYGYLYTFALVEEFIVPFIMDQLRGSVHDDDVATRALLGFASEEAKHIQLFNTFCAAFRRDFGSQCATIDPAAEIADTILEHHPLAVALVILQTEWMTQDHYVESVKDEQDLDPVFKDMLKHHWLDEAQHAKMDTLMIDTLLAHCDADSVRDGIEDYFAISGFLDAGLMRQVRYDCDSFETATGRSLSGVERQAFIANQSQALRYTYMGSGMRHPNFLSVVKGISPETHHRIEELIPAFC